MSGKKAGKRWRKRYVVILLIAVLGMVFFMLLMKHRAENNNLQDVSSVTILFDGDEYTGSYEGDSKNGKPHGTGTFTAEGNGLKYEGEWEKGKFTGDGEVTFLNGIKEQGTFKEGKRNGTMIRFENEKDYTIVDYKMDLPCGREESYKNGVVADADYYYDGVLLSELIKGAKSKSLSEIVKDKDVDRLFKLQATVQHIEQTGTKCIAILMTEDGHSFVTSYSNGTARQKQAYMPNLNIGDEIILFGYDNGSFEYNITNDYENSGNVFPSISPVFACLKDKSNLKELINDNSYENIIKNPYLHLDVCKNYRLVIDNVSVMKGKKKYYLKAHEENDTNQIYYVEYKSESLPLRGETIQIQGILIGQYKELKEKQKKFEDAWRKEVALQKKEDSKSKTLDMGVYSYEYDIYPLIKEK